MAYILKEGGFPTIPGLPAIALEGGAHDQMVHLKSWIALVEQDSALEEISLPDERPHYKFKNEEGKEIIIVYYFGYIIPKNTEDLEVSDIMQDYTNHLNELAYENQKRNQRRITSTLPGSLR